MRTCDEYNGHATVVTTSRRLRDLFRKRYWVRCFECDLRDGPYPTDEIATAKARVRDFTGRPWT